MKKNSNIYIRFLRQINIKKHLYIISGILMILVSILSTLSPEIMIEITDKAITNGNMNDLIYYIGLYFIIGLMLFIFSYASDYIYILIGNEIKYKLRMKLLDKISHFSGKELNDKKTGEIISIVEYDVDNVQEFVTNMFLNLLSDIVVTIGLIIIMVNLEGRLVIIAILIQTLVIISQKIFNKKIYIETIKYRENYGNSMSLMQEFVNFIVNFLFLNVKDIFLERYTKVLNYGMKKKIKISKYNSLNSYVYQMIQTIQSCVILGYGGYLVMNSELSLGVFIVFITYTKRLFMPFIRISKLSANLKMIKVSIEKIVTVLDYEIEEDKIGDDIDLNQLSKDIEFKNIKFSYDNKKDVFNNLNFNISANKINAIVGESGSGKTTIINLLFKMWKAKEGQILIGDLEIGKIPIDLLRRSITVVPQNTFLLNDNIKNNLTMYDDNISNEKINEVLKVVGLYDFVEELPDKLNTQLGENGVKFSGGQRQKLAVARALLRDTSIVVFDESTSAMDNLSESFIMQNIKPYIKNKTVIIIAHRLTTIQDADIIHVMKDGRVVENGTHKDLLLYGQEYRKLYVRKGFLNNEKIESMR